ncbi:hypothetical protein OG906_17685 [Streptomyces sp. NBC_01426]|uniref:hypothetical protein n=1 Tax=Streptomyces sp. NBC_01426 TaxID=2975866 RepID=UPI002E35D5E0|nr:hypothetical protein [Streptomyces sp. NBC_01426]
MGGLLLSAMSVAAAIVVPIRLWRNKKAREDSVPLIAFTADVERALDRGAALPIEEAGRLVREAEGHERMAPAALRAHLAHEVRALIKYESKLIGVAGGHRSEATIALMPVANTLREANKLLIEAVARHHHGD